MRKSGFFQCTSYEADIIACAAAASGLSHHNGKPIRVITAREHRLHKLTDNGNGWEAGIVIDVFESHVDSGTVIVIEYYDVITVLSEDRLQYLKMDGTI